LKLIVLFHSFAVGCHMFGREWKAFLFALLDSAAGSSYEINLIPESTICSEKHRYSDLTEIMKRRCTSSANGLRVLIALRFSC
jgi:hypothetical protein